MLKIIGIILLATLCALLAVGAIEAIVKFDLLTTPEGTPYTIHAQFLNQWEETWCDNTGCYQSHRLLVRLRGAIFPTLLYSGQAVSSGDNTQYPYCLYQMVNSAWGPAALVSICGQTTYPETNPFGSD